MVWATVHASGSSVPVFVQNKTRHISSLYSVLLTKAPFHRLQLKIHEEGQWILTLRCLQLKTWIKKWGPFFLLLSLPKPLPVVKLFDVKNYWTVFSCDFTKALDLLLCCLFWVINGGLRGQRNATGRNRTEIWPKPFLSLALCCKVKYLVKVGQTPGSVISWVSPFGLQTKWWIISVTHCWFKEWKTSVNAP